jgi:hypothetical protein
VCEPTPARYDLPCTCDDDYCATVHATVISCDCSYNGSCKYDTGLTAVTDALERELRDLPRLHHLVRGRGTIHRSER